MRTRKPVNTIRPYGPDRRPTFLEGSQQEEVAGLIRDDWTMDEILGLDIPCHPDHFFKHPEHHPEDLLFVFSAQDVDRVASDSGLEVMTWLKRNTAIWVGNRAAHREQDITGLVVRMDDINRVVVLDDDRADWMEEGEDGTLSFYITDLELIKSTSEVGS